MTAARVPLTVDSAQGCVKNGESCLINKACRTGELDGGHTEETAGMRDFRF